MVVKPWRVQWDNGTSRSRVESAGALDEVVLGGDKLGEPALFHAEHMGAGVLDVHVGGLHRAVSQRGDRVRLTIVEIPDDARDEWAWRAPAKHRARAKKTGRKGGR